MKKKCIFCDRLNTDEADYCSNCGKPLLADNIICSKCKAENSANNKFCNKCGEKLFETPDDLFHNLGVLFVCLVIIAILGCIFNWWHL